MSGRDSAPCGRAISVLPEGSVQGHRSPMPSASRAVFIPVPYESKLSTGRIRKQPGACCARLRALAERTRFELVVQNYPYVGLANRWFQPLTHLSFPRGGDSGRDCKYTKKNDFCNISSSEFSAGHGIPQWDIGCPCSERPVSSTGGWRGELPLGALVSHFVREIKQFVGKGGAVESF